MSTGEPIAGADVSLSSSTLPGNRISTNTDSQGHFQFTNLAAGHYTVGAEKTGFVLVLFGERHYGRGGSAIMLRAAEHRDVRIQLPHTNVITGRVVDEWGNPAVGASVEVMRFSMVFLYRRALEVASAHTDFRGIFRIQSLTAGDYAVCAWTQQTDPLNQGQSLQAKIDAQRRSIAFMFGPLAIESRKQLAELEAQLPPFVPPVRGYAPVCYPGSTSPPQPTITLGPDEERSGVDMQFAVARLARIEGTVSGMPPDPRDLEMIRLLSADGPREGSVTEVTRPDVEGRFSFSNVPPGRYRLFLRSGPDGPSHPARLRATADVVVADKDISNVVLDLQPGVTVSGRVIFRGSLPPPPAALLARADLEVRLDPAVPGPLTAWTGGSTTRPDATGQFVLHDVFPGQYRISESAREPTGWVFDPTKIPGGDVTGQVVDVKRQDLTGVTVTLTDQQRTEITGTIRTDEGEPAPAYVIILLYPVDEKYWTPYSRRLYATRANEDGVFVIKGLPSGNYRLATLLDADWGAWFDPAFLHRIDRASTPLSIARDEKKVLNLRVPGDR